jgi:hypothetical protein
VAFKQAIWGSESEHSLPEHLAQSMLFTYHDLIYIQECGGDENYDQKSDHFPQSGGYLAGARQRHGRFR